jgi:hypothetical protein
VKVEVLGLHNTYDSLEWHQANNLFVYEVPMTSTSSSKIATHAYPYDKKHPCFSKTWKLQITLASLLVHSFFFTHSKVCLHCSIPFFVFF